jgi:hypothetical protein
MQPSTTALDELERMTGCAVPLDAFHGCVRRATQVLRDATSHGVVLVTCSDEYQGEIRGAFERDVARPLMAAVTTGSRRTFAVSNLGGRVEPGALKLAEEHFSSKSRGTKSLVIEIAGHCGVLPQAHGRLYGKLDRFGSTSDCCGALALLISNHSAASVVRHPWFDQLTLFFGPERLAWLRADASPMRMLSAAIVHAVLQGETAIVDVLREPPPTPTHVLIFVGVVLNQPGTDEVVPVGLHHLHSDGSEVRVVRGTSLRSSPSALRYGDYGGRLRVSCDEGLESSTPRRVEVRAKRQVAQLLRPLHSPADELAKARAALVKEHVERTRRQVEHLRRRPNAWRVYARPILRGAVQALSMIAPEVGLAAMLLQSGHDAARAAHLEKLLKHGPASEEARTVLKRIEAEIQQLGHRDAQDVLEILVSEESPLLGV